MGGPQIVLNHREVPWVYCAQNGTLRSFPIGETTTRKRHTLYNVAEETDTQAVIPDASKFIADDKMYFALNKTDKPGLYSVGQVTTEAPYALFLAKRFHTSTYVNHTPYAAFSTGPNMYLSFDDNGTASVAKLEGNNSPTRSSKAVIETVYVDAGDPEIVKEWTDFLVLAKPLPNNCTITVDARVDSAAGYDAGSSNALTDDNDQVTYDAVTANTFWHRQMTSVVGRRIQVRIQFTSSGTSKATLYGVTLVANKTKMI